MLRAFVPMLSPPSVISLNGKNPPVFLLSTLPALLNQMCRKNLSCFSFTANTSLREYTTSGHQMDGFSSHQAILLDSSRTPAGCPTVQFSSDIAYPELAAERRRLWPSGHKTALPSQLRLQLQVWLDSRHLID